MTTTPDQAWARGATAAITMPPIAPAPPPPPTYYPPVSGGNGDQPGRGPRRRLPRWIAGAAALAVVAGAGIAGGWALRSHDTTPAPVAAPTSTAPAAAAPTLTPDEAKTQACNAFSTAGTQWAAAYHDTWLPAVTASGWKWSDPQVKDAVTKFSSVETQVVTEINGLIAPSTPPDVVSAIHAYTSAILAYSAGHGAATQAEMNAQETAIDNAADRATKVCGIK